VHASPMKTRLRRILYSARRLEIDVAERSRPPLQRAHQPAPVAQSHRIMLWSPKPTRDGCAAT